MESELTPPPSRPHIVVAPGYCGGKPHVAGHRVKVQHIAVWHERQGLSPEEIVAGHFRDQGLMLNDYLRAAIRHPALFTQSAATVTGNVEGVAEHFRDQGLTVADYARAALRQPAHFSMRAARVIANIETVAGHFAEHGLTIGDYLRAALKQPALFAMTPSTINPSLAPGGSEVGSLAPQRLTTAPISR